MSPARRERGSRCKGGGKTGQESSSTDDCAGSTPAPRPSWRARCGCRAVVGPFRIVVHRQRGHASNPGICGAVHSIVRPGADGRRILGREEHPERALQARRIWSLDISNQRRGRGWGPKRPRGSSTATSSGVPEIRFCGHSPLGVSEDRWHLAEPELSALGASAVILDPEEVELLRLYRHVENLTKRAAMWGAVAGDAAGGPSAPADWRRVLGGPTWCAASGTACWADCRSWPGVVGIPDQAAGRTLAELPQRCDTDRESRSIADEAARGQVPSLLPRCQTESVQPRSWARGERSILGVTRAVPPDPPRLIRSLR